MTKTLSDPTVSGFQNFFDSILAIGKILLQSRNIKIAKVSGSKPLIIMGNGPSLRQTLTDNADLLKTSETLAVNFAANSPDLKSSLNTTFSQTLTSLRVKRMTMYDDYTRIWQKWIGK